MTTPLRPRAAFVLMCLAAALPRKVSAQARPRPLDHDAHERWRAIRSETLSPDGSFAAYVLTAAGETGRLRLRALPSGPELEIPRGHDPRFTEDSRFLTVVIDAAAVEARETLASDTLAVVDLEGWRLDGTTASSVTRTPGLLDIQVAPRGRPQVAYRLDAGARDALRRLGKPAWMVNYNGEMHALRRSANRRDWAIRMQQFFDHYLLGTAPPVWMVEGIPASQKGQTLGLDLVEPRGTPMTDARISSAGIRPEQPSGKTPARATSPEPAAPSPRP